jgi:formylglycine-generating enzyme required for sulfatase activity
MKPLEGDQTRLNCWKWGYPRARQIVLNYFSKDDSEKATSLSFRNRKVHEQYVARLLTRYATPEDYEELSDHVGNPQWENLWDLVITTPLEQVVDGCDVEGAEPKRFSRALEWLFHRPTNSDWRRPTALMWQADQQCRRLLRSDTAHFHATRGRFREILHEQFLAILHQHKDLVPTQIAASLVDPATYQILGKDSGSSLPFDNGEFLMGEEERDMHGKLIRDKVHVTLSRFGMQKLLISNAQFQLFDKNFIGEADRGRFGALNQPANFVSWFDAFWFSRFIGEVEVNEGKYRVTLPTEAQWEYSARAGCDEDYFHAWVDEDEKSKGHLQVNEESLPYYAHFDQNWEFGSTVPVYSKLPNLWGLRMAGNLVQWTLDAFFNEWLAIRNAEDPRATGGLGSFRVLRGGGWSDGAADCKSAVRDGFDPSLRGDYGFRVALSPSGIPKSAEQQSGIKIE